MLTSRYLRNRAALMNGGKTLQGHLGLVLAVELCCITCRLHCTAEKSGDLRFSYRASAANDLCHRREGYSALRSCVFVNKGWTDCVQARKYWCLYTKNLGKKQQKVEKIEVC